MIKYVKGNLLQADVEALVNTINTVGVMGKGIALQFKERFPENFKHYKKAVELHQVNTGKMYTVNTNRSDKLKWVINFPTKKHWLHPSKMEYIESGLDDLLHTIKEKKIHSIAIPPLGCGNGGLNWVDVRPLIEQKLGSLSDVEILVYEPSEAAYDKSVKKKVSKPRLTPTRATILYLMKNYAQFNYSLTVLETQKLVYFLNRLGDPDAKKIEFKKYIYGPYAPVLNHVLYDMDGYYLTGMKFKDAKTFDPLEVLEKNYSEVDSYITSHSTDTHKKRVDALLNLIEGFETPLSMELLSSVDFVMVNEVSDKSNLDEVIDRVQNWNDRKRNLMPAEFIEIAFRRLANFNGI